MSRTQANAAPMPMDIMDMLEKKMEEKEPKNEHARKKKKKG